MEGFDSAVDALILEQRKANDYQRLMSYKDNAETMGIKGQMPVEAAKVVSSHYEKKAKEC